jgi:hypothetical protein
MSYRYACTSEDVFAHIPTTPHRHASEFWRLLSWEFMKFNSYLHLTNSFSLISYKISLKFQTTVTKKWPVWTRVHVLTRFANKRPTNTIRTQQINYIFKHWSYNVSTRFSSSRHTYPLTPKLNPSAQRCLTRFLTGVFASWTVNFANICVKNQ